MNGHNVDTQEDNNDILFPGSFPFRSCPASRRMCYNNFRYSHGKRRSPKTANHHSL